MKKILFLVTQSEMGGAQRYVYEISKALAKRYEILVAAGSGDGELFEKLKQAGISFRQLSQMQRTPWPWQVIFTVKEIANLIRKERPDVLFLCSTTAGLLGSIAARICKTPRPRVIYRIGGWAFRDPRPSWQNLIVLLLEKLTAPFKDLIIVNSEYDWRIAVEKRIVSPEKIVKIYNGIDIDPLDFLPKEEAKARLSAYGTEKLIGCVANLYKTKGLEYLIEAASILDCKLVIIGEGKERPALEAMIQKYDLKDKVILAGRIKDAYKYLKAFDVFVLPSIKEGFPWVILEALAAEIPIIATKVGAIPEIIPEEFLTEPDDAEALAKKINQMLEHPTVPQPKQEFSTQRMVEATEKFLQASQ